MADGSNPFAQFDPDAGALGVSPGQSVPTRAVPQIAGPVDNQGRPLLPLVRALEGSGAASVSKPAFAGSRGGAVGTFQIMPDTARGYGYDPSMLTNQAYNTAVAAHILGDLSQKYGGDLDSILIAYNSTPARLRSYLSSGENPSALLPETQHYLYRAHSLLGDAAPSSAALANYLERLDARLEPGWRVEINLNALDWLRDALNPRLQ